MSAPWLPRKETCTLPAPRTACSASNAPKRADPALGRCPQSLGSALHFTAAIGSSDCTQLLIDYGADANAADKDGYTPLHMAAGYLHTSTVITLLVRPRNTPSPLPMQKPSMCCSHDAVTTRRPVPPGGRYQPLSPPVRRVHRTQARTRSRKTCRAAAR